MLSDTRHIEFSQWKVTNVDVIIIELGLIWNQFPLPSSTVCTYLFLRLLVKVYFL